ncbi:MULTISPECIES: Ig-like domain-containing protein [Streptomyces]|uniref:Ig-like domain-containing protein n=2 Tax=Streptomyces rochei group TaxID=2867164 RepID=A0ABY6BXU7_9ACTN|nr:MULTISPECIES: Ig-like domain-containing protein [Streptomyces]MBQ0914255.1 L,D-transpeptidase family protein [Streptomyces sp. RM99]MBU8549304.1 L,D-transpeptidase family protein [Streptomyces sp. Osf17]MBU8556082.1 L,D-transpeptidase family protein [Streptomyces sp. Babs14]MBX4177065.1 L,D-transpeptidase family protein [Streptomyces geysiriensis]MCC8452593.1 Ig-like domain-containing protein [Streptomyces rochei]
MSNTVHFQARGRTVVGCTLLVIALGASVTACTGGDDHPLSAAPYDAAGQISFNGPTDAGKKADPDKPLEVVAEGADGRITDVTAVDAAGRYVAGELSADGARWHSTSPLAAGARYTVRVSTEDGDGAPGRKVLTFETGMPSAKKTLDVAFGPKAGAYGVGQPVTAELSQPVADPAQRAIVERALKVRSTPAVEGAWHWVDDKKLHYRPKEYWPAHATVQVTSALSGIKIGDRLWGGKAEPLTITTDDRVVAVTDAAAHTLTLFKDGEEVRQIPVTTGKPGFETRNGVKVVLGKEPFVRMRSSTVGIAEGSSESYDLPVYFATRVTWSGEYVHAAPWSVGSQGSANVSHGCVGMSTANAEWFFGAVQEGDLVEVVNSDGETMEPFGNGFGDWNLDWAKWTTGSALTGGAGGTADQDAARLRPTVV